MKGLDRRRFLQQLLTAGAAGAASSLLPPLARRALAQAVAPAFPTIVIQLRGGVDSVMHFSARTGFVNRNVTDATIRQTAAGVRWHTGTLSAMATHMEDAVVLRNVALSGSHPNGQANLWFGVESPTSAAVPWANFLASGLAARAQVPAPNVLAHWQRDEAITDYVNFSNRSPSASAAAQRILSIDGFAGALNVTAGLPPLARQQQVYGLVGKLDQRVFSPIVQRHTLDAFTSANRQANDLLGQVVPPIWPPDAATMTAFNLSAADLTRTGNGGVPGFKAMSALAFQLVKNGVSHVVTFTNEGAEYDSHNDNAARQTDRSVASFGQIARLLTALKATPSPLVAGASLFDTTHVAILSELARSPQADNGDGTQHHPWGNVVLFGGNFKRGFAFGELSAGLQGIRADFATGALDSGATPTLRDVAATIMTANGVDPSGWSAGARAITAVLRS